MESFWSRIEKLYTNCSTGFFGKTVNQTLNNQNWETYMEWLLFVSCYVLEQQCLSNIWQYKDTSFYHQLKGLHKILCDFLMWHVGAEIDIYAGTLHSEI